MKRDFSKWHSLKSRIDAVQDGMLYRTQEVWWCALGANVGVEADGKNDLFERPVLIFRKFNKDMFWGLPMTSRVKQHKPFHFSFSLHQKSQTAILSQMRILSSKRLIRRLGKVSDAQLVALNKAIVSFITETDPLRGPRVPNGNSKDYVIKR